jgi:hypothetical protein
MRTASSLVLCWLLAAAVSGVSAPARNGWKPLFNGKNLHGWKALGAEKWVADGGTILGESAAGHYGYLVTSKTYKNFELRLEFKPDAGNSGLFYHSRITGINPRHGADIVGPQVEIDPRRHTGGIYESGGRGWVALPTAQGERSIRPGKWNHLVVRVDGNRTVTQLNGVEIVDFRDPKPRFTDGHLALQIHTGGGVKIRFKDMYLRGLPE